jgi:predicted metal-dependent peptidase
MNKKDLLAKLLSTENITVLRQPVATASFNVETRVLTLPVWKNLSENIENMLIAHEVGHALYTPFRKSETEEFNNTYHEINTNMLDYKIKIKNLKNQIYCFKHDLGRFNENIRIFKNNMQHFMMMMDICNRMCKLK